MPVPRFLHTIITPKIRDRVASPSATALQFMHENPSRGGGMPVPRFFHTIISKRIPPGFLSRFSRSAVGQAQTLSRRSSTSAAAALQTRPD
jgi:hypothetical protein